MDVPNDKEDDVRAMLKNHEPSWSKQPGESNVNKMRIDLVPDDEPFKSPPYRAGPRSRELEPVEIDNQLKAGIIEPYMPECAAPVLFVHKKDRKLQFFINYRSSTP